MVRLLSRHTRENYAFVDSWVLGHLLLAVLLLSVLRSPGLLWWEAAFLLYGAIRVFEVVTYQINVLLLDEYRKGKKGEKSTGNNRPFCSASPNCTKRSVT